MPHRVVPIEEAVQAYKVGSAGGQDRGQGGAQLCVCVKEGISRNGCCVTMPHMQDHTVEVFPC